MLTRGTPLYKTINNYNNDYMHVIYQIPDEQPIEFTTGPKSINYCKKMELNYQNLIGMDSFWYLTEKYIQLHHLEDVIYRHYQDAERFLEMQKLAYDSDMTEFSRIINNIIEDTSYDDFLEMCMSMDLHMYKVSPVVFDKAIENEQRGTRTQSYTRQDHIELIAFTSYVRLIMPLILGYININVYTIGKYHIEYRIIDILLNRTYLHNIDAFVKMEESIAISIGTVVNKLPVEEIQRIIQSKSIPEDGLYMYGLGIAFIHIIMTYNVFRDNKEVSIMSIYTSKAINSVKVTKTTNQLANKKSASNAMSDDKPMGMLEAYKVSTSVSTADVVLTNHIYGNKNNYRLYGKLDNNIYSKIYDDLSVIYKSDNPLKNTITNTQLKFITDLGSLVFPSDGYIVINNDSLHVLTSSLFTWLWMNNYKELATYITSIPILDGSIEVKHNINLAGDKYNHDKLELCRKSFSYANEISVSIEQIKINIDFYVKHMYSEKWFMLATSFTDDTYWYVPKIRNVLLDVFTELYNLYVPMEHFNIGENK